MGAQARLEIEQARGLPAGPQREGNRQGADLAHEILGRGREGRPLREDVDPPRVGSDRLRRGDGGHIRQPPEVRGQSVDPGRRAPRSGDRQIDGRAAVGREARLERVAHVTRARALREHARVDACELDAEERDPERYQKRRACNGEDGSPPHHDLRQAVPEAGALGPRAPLGRAAKACRCKRVHAGAERSQDRGEHDQRICAGEHRGEHAADAHRVQEGLREGEQRGQGHRNRDRAEQDGPPGGGHGPPQRFAAGPHACELLPVPRDDEEAVVDREAEPEAGDEVCREDGQRREGVDDPQAEEGREDRHEPADRRESRRNQAAEDEQRQHEEERKREELRAHEILLDLGGHLLVRDQPAAELDTGLMTERALDPLGHPSLLCGRDWLQRGGHVGRAPVARYERRAVRVVEADDVGDCRIAREACRHALDARPRGCDRHAAVRADEREHGRIRAVARRALELLPGSHAGRARIFEVRARRRQPPGHRSADDCGERGPGERQQQDLPRPAVDQV